MDILASAGYPWGDSELVFWENVGGTCTNWIKHIVDTDKSLELL